MIKYFKVISWGIGVLLFYGFTSTGSMRMNDCGVTTTPPAINLVLKNMNFQRVITFPTMFVGLQQVFINCLLNIILLSKKLS